MAQPIIDTHVHMFDLAHPVLSYDWLAPEARHPVIGDIDAIKMLRYDVEGFWAEARFADIEGFVHVQAALGSADPVDETRWLTQLRERSPIPFTIIGHADLGRADAAAVLDQHGESPYFVGIRDFGVEPALATGEIVPAFERSFALMAERGLVLDVDCEWPNMAACRRMAERHPGLTIVLEHAGFPRRRDDAYFAAWQRAIDDLSRAPNVTCKISGLGMADPRFSRASLRPWIEACLEAFGAGRCVLGSNWPLDRLFSSYDAIMALYREFVSTLSESDQNLVTVANARSIYRL